MTVGGCEVALRLVVSGDVLGKSWEGEVSGSLANLGLERRYTTHGSQSCV